MEFEITIKLLIRINERLKSLNKQKEKLLMKIFSFIKNRFYFIE